MKECRFPIWDIIDGKCACGRPDCPASAGKHPIYKWGDLKEGEVLQPESGAQVGGWGIVTGQRSGVWVLDVDIKPDKGIDGFAELAKMGELPPTKIVASPSGSKHFYFLLPDFLVPTSAGKLAPGLDVRGEGGMVVAAHSKHKNGYYKIENPGPAVQAPAWLLERIQALGAPKVAVATGKVVPIAKEHKDYPRRLELAREHCLTADPAVEGSDGSGRTMSVARHLTVRLELPIDVAYGLLRKHFNPRCEPPWEDKLLYKKVVDAAQNGLGTPTGIAPEGWELQPTPREIQPISDMPPPERRRHDPNHRYTFEVGQAVNGKCYKVALGEVVSDLVQLEEWVGVLQHDEFGERLVAVNPPLKLQGETTSITDGDIDSIRCWFEVVQGKLVSKDTMSSAVNIAALRMPFHPVKDYLESLPIVDGGYLDKFARDVFGEIQSVQVEFVKKALVSAVKRIYEPGCFVKSMLILYGPQDAGKSTFCKRLFGEKWFKEDISDLKSKDAVQELLGIWGVEMAEMDSISRAEVKTSKSFVSRAFDVFRPSYAPRAITRYRQNIFIGTTNEEDFLRDATGSTRYMPIEVPDEMGTDWDRDIVWAAALNLYKSGYQAYLNKSEVEEANEVRDAHQYVDPWTDAVERFMVAKERVSAIQVTATLLPEITHRDGRSMARIQGILRRVCGKSWRVGNDKTRYYTVPPEIMNRASHLKVVK